MTDQETYKLEEMKQLRGLIGVLVQEIAKVEIFTVTAIAGVMAFYLNRTGPNVLVDLVVRYGPVFLTFLLLFKALRYARRILQIDDYLVELEKEFVKEGAWVTYFRKTAGTRVRQILERILITFLFFVISIGLAIYPPFGLGGAKPSGVSAQQHVTTQDQRKP
jgi:hypothetical protein